MALERPKSSAVTVTFADPLKVWPPIVNVPVVLAACVATPP
jgi:hypothetical protein